MDTHRSFVDVDVISYGMESSKHREHGIPRSMDTCRVWASLKLKQIPTHMSIFVEADLLILVLHVNNLFLTR